jgi:hypothetical protein
LVHEGDVRGVFCLGGRATAIAIRGKWTPRPSACGCSIRVSYQSDGGDNYREIVIGVPNIEAYNASDTTHFGHVFEGKTIAWARVKERTDDNGKKVLFVEEIQSQRAQAGRKAGFKPRPVKQRARGTRIIVS